MMYCAWREFPSRADELIVCWSYAGSKATHTHHLRVVCPDIDKRDDFLSLDLTKLPRFCPWHWLRSLGLKQMLESVAGRGGGIILSWSVKTMADWTGSMESCLAFQENAARCVEAHLCSFRWWRKKRHSGENIELLYIYCMQIKMGYTKRNALITSWWSVWNVRDKTKVCNRHARHTICTTHSERRQLFG